MITSSPGGGGTYDRYGVTNKWTSTYIAAPDPSIDQNGSTAAPSISATGTPLTDGSTGGLSLDAIIAIVALGVASITLAFGTFLLYRMHRIKRSQKVIQVPGSNTQEANDNSLYIKTSMITDLFGRDPQEPSVSGNSEFGKDIFRNPQRSTAQFPSQCHYPAEPHTTIPLQSSNDPHLPATGARHSTTDRLSYEYHGHNRPTTLDRIP